jgi:signal transduction histidine kinase
LENQVLILVQTSYNIIKVHGGDIKVESKVDEGNPDNFGKGEGTKFIIQLPAY